MTTERIVIVGGPRTGKSWLAAELSLNTTEGNGPLGTAQIYCGDPLSKVKEPMPTVHYLPEGLAMEDESTRWIVDNWFSMPGPWICEGWIMARALRKWRETMEGIESARPGLVMQEFPCDRIIVFEEQRADCDLLRGQVAMHRGVHTVWNEINDYFSPIAEFR